jgi:hypothetical protein
MAVTNITPILRILDEAKTKECYVDFLGFKIDWAHRAEGPLYMQGNRSVVQRMNARPEGCLLATLTP